MQYRKTMAGGERWKIVAVMIATMWKARYKGVPRTLDNMPFLWLPLRLNPTLKGKAALSYIDEHIERLFRHIILRSLLFRERRCLAKGLVLAWYAKKLDIKTIIHFGVRVKKGSIKGHCWVACLESEKAKDDKNGEFVEIWRYQV